MLSLRGLRQLVAPERVVAVAPEGGVRPDWARLAERNLFAGRFAGPRLTVGTTGEAPAGAVVAAVEDLAPGPFLALIALPQPDPAGLLRRLHGRGCRAAVLVGAGAGPLGSASEVRRELAALAAGLGVRVVGPTRVGVLLPRLGLNAGATDYLPPAGHLALVTQSDAIAAAALDWALGRGDGFSLAAALGDSGDVELGDILDHLALDPGTRAILLHLEGVSDARRFVSAARAAARIKPVVVLRPGRFAAGGRRLDGDLAFEAALARAGALRARTLENLFGIAATLVGPGGGSGARRTRPRPRGGRLAIVSNGGGPALLAVDALLGGGGMLATLTPATERGPDAAPEPKPGLSKPIDIGLEAGSDEVSAALRLTLRDPGSDAVLALVAPGGVEPPTRHAAAIADVAREPAAGRRPLLAAVIGEATAAPARRLLAAAGVPVYASPEAAVAAFLDLATYERRQRLLRRVPLAGPEDGGEPGRDLAAVALLRGITGPGTLDGAATARLLAAYGLPPPPWPPARHPPARDGLKLVAGMRVDPGFGPVLTLAQGAPGADAVGEVAVALPPLDGLLAEAMLEGTALGRLLLRPSDGERALSDPAPLLDALVRLACIVVDRPEIAGFELELNLPSAHGLETLAARVEVAPVPPGTDSTARLAVRPYPAELEERIRLKDGRRVLLRPIRPADAEAMRRGFSRMSPEDLRLRLFGPVRELSPELAARLAQIDYDREMALVAEDPDLPGLLLGGARVSMEPDGRSAEFAVTVRSDAKGLGLGRTALGRVLDHARRRGVAEVWGTILIENRPMLALARNLGFTLGRDPDEPGALRAALRLDGAGG